jgi:hypothetical protein
MSEMKALVDAAAAVSRSRAPEDAAAAPAAAAAAADEAPSRRRGVRKADLPREERLLHNRTAAAESRKRKREMVGDLEASVAYFSRSNASLKRGNAELEREILLAKQRILAFEKGLPVPAPAVNHNLLELLKSTRPRDDDEEARAAHFAATQAMYKSMGFPPAAARQAAGTFAAAYGNDSPATSAKKPSPVLKVDSPGVNQDQAQAAHFAATQALYKSMGFPPRAAKEAAATFSRCHQTVTAPPAPSAVPSVSSSTYFEALNKIALQQAAAAKDAAKLATAAMQAAKLHQAAMQAPGPTMMQAPVMGFPQVPATGVPGLSGLSYNQLTELLTKLRQNQR